MVDGIELQQQEEAVVAEVKTSRKRATKVVREEGVREWKDVVPLIREMKEAGATVPEIAEKLELSYVLVNQVMLQSYKMSVQTVQVFEAQERKRLGVEA